VTAIPCGSFARAPLGIMHDDINARRRVRGPGLQGVVGRVASRGGTFDAIYNSAGVIWREIVIAIRESRMGRKSHSQHVPRPAKLVQ